MKNKGALNGVKVLDLTRVLAGPFCTMMLADMGAEVIKIEMPNVGDDSRSFPPFVNGESSYYMNLNRNKKGITLNLKGKGKGIFLELAKKADVVVENFRPGTMEKLGIGWEDLKKVNPRLVYGAVSGFGHYGPYKDRAGYDIIGQAMSGLMSTTGWPGGEPTRTGGPMSDTMAGLSVTIGILAALNYRNQTGIGQKVDVSLVDSLVASLQIINQIYLVDKRIPQRIGNRYESSYPYDSFTTTDGFVVIGCANNKFWELLCQIMGNQELAQHPDMDTNAKRVKNHEAVRPIVEEWTKTMTTKEVVDTLLAAGVPVAPINNIEQVVNDPHIAEAREMFVEVEYPKVGKLKVTGPHIKLSETKAEIRTPSPMLGQHNEEIYGDLLGFTSDQIATLREEGTI